MAFVVTAVASALVAGASTAVILTAVTQVGIAMTVVGAVTKSKELTKIGGVMSLVGGVGGLVNGALSGAAGAAADSAAGVAGATDGAEAAWSGMANDAVAGINSATPSMAFDGLSGAATGSSAAAPGLSATNSLDSFLSKGATASSASGVPGIVPDASGVVAPTSQGPYTNEYGLPTGGATDKALGVNGPLGIQELSTPADGLMAQMKSKLGAAWDGLGSQGKTELLKSVLAMPGGIQNQKNIDEQLAIQQQKVNQSSYGNSVPTFGIINKARG